MTVKSLRRSIDFYWGNFRLPVVEVMERAAVRPGSQTAAAR
jgi:hypothetical protein